MRWLEERYARVLSWTCRHKAFGLVVVALVVGFLLFTLKLLETSTFSGGISPQHPPRACA